MNMKKMNLFFMAMVAIYGVIFQQAIKVNAIDPKTIQLYMDKAPANGNEAHSNCAGLNLELYGNEDEQAHGVIVDSLEFERYLIAQAKELGWIPDPPASPGVVGESIWIGLEKRADGEYYWGDGTKLEDTDYSNWVSQGNGNCVWLANDGWTDALCATATVPGSICQYSRPTGEDVAFSFYGATVTWALIIVVAVIVGIIIVIRCVSCRSSSAVVAI